MSATKVNKPIIIFGIGRCGSTIVHKVLSEHPNVYFLTDYLKSKPTRLSTQKSIIKLMDVPFVNRKLRKKFPPRECYEFWDLHYKGFRKPFRDLTKDDLIPFTQNNLHADLNYLATITRNRALIKITRWPRLGFLEACFPGAKFIHIERDSRAVVNSILNCKFWLGWQGPSNWRWGELDFIYKDLWGKYNKSFEALAAISLLIYYQAFEKSSSKLTNSLLNIKYEDFTKNLNKVLKDILYFCNLKWTPQYEKTVAKYYDIKSTNYKWQKGLSTKQIKIISSILEELLIKRNYITENLC